MPALSMKPILFFFFLWPLLVSGQEERASTGLKRTISGTLYHTSFSQGGAYIDDRSIDPVPLVNTTFFIVRIPQDNSMPTLVDSVTTNENGYFRIVLPAGKYGIVSAEEKDRLAPGLYFPQNAQSEDQWVGSTTLWETNRTFPLDLTLASVDNLVMTVHYRSYCYLCP
jgi:hypothetical protein